MDYNELLNLVSVDNHTSSSYNYWEHFSFALGFWDSTWYLPSNKWIAIKFGIQTELSISNRVPSVLEVFQLWNGDFGFLPVSKKLVDGFQWNFEFSLQTQGPYFVLLFLKICRLEILAIRCVLINYYSSDANICHSKMQGLW